MSYLITRRFDLGKGLVFTNPPTQRHETIRLTLPFCLNRVKLYSPKDVDATVLSINMGPLELMDGRECSIRVCDLEKLPPFNWTKELTLQMTFVHYFNETVNLLIAGER